MPRVMSPLPRSADPRKLCTAGQLFSGTQAVARLSRLAATVVDDTPLIEYRMEFLRDERHRCMVRTAVSGRVSLLCQRCLQAVELDVDSSSLSQIVWTQEQVDAADHEVVFVEDETLDLLELLEDEALLTLPLIPKHKQCEPPEFSQVEPDELDVVDTKPNPFAVLASLKSDSKD